MSDWENYQKPTNRSQHPEPILVSPQSEIVSLHLSSLTPRRWSSFLLQRLWGESEARIVITVEAVIRQVSGEDAKPSGQRVTERGRLSHPADLAKTDETISKPRPGQFFSSACILCLRAAFHNISNPNAPFTLLQCGGEATAQECARILGIQNVYDVFCW